MIVNASGGAIGTMDKMAAHRSGTLHRAFSVFIFNSKGQLLLQQRALDKYHSGGLWTNACCSHPKLGEFTIDAAHRRLQEEMGMDCELNELFQFTYRHEFENGLIENEYDHVFMGISDELPSPNLAEVASFRYIDTDALLFALAKQPAQYTAWFKICLEQVLEIYCQID
jgi:isopentenyl-diphosphate delta-isomerase